MKANLDLRIRRTRKLIWEALLKLIAEKGFTSITVNEICELAMVHRTTFYKHYEDKYDLLRQGIIGLFDEFASNSAPATKDVVLTHSFNTPPAQLARLFSHAAENQSTYKTLLSSEGNNLYRELANMYIARFIFNRAADITKGTDQSQMPLEIVSQFTAGATVNLLQWWLEKGMPYSPEQMAIYITKLSALGAYSVLGISFGTKEGES
jgi:AcrR family transcriptional regulator